MPIFDEHAARRFAIICLGAGLVVGKVCVTILLAMGREVPQSFWWLLATSVVALVWVVQHNGRNGSAPTSP